MNILELKTENQKLRADLERSNEVINVLYNKTETTIQELLEKERKCYEERLATKDAEINYLKRQNRDYSICLKTWQDAVKFS